MTDQDIVDMYKEVCKLETRTGIVEHRQFRDGNKWFNQTRIGYRSLDGSVEYGEWKTTIEIPNYEFLYLVCT